MKPTAIMTCAVLLVACDMSPARTSLTEITASSAGSYLSPSLCELTRSSDYVGHYSVSAMYSQVETVDGSDNAFTYIELEASDVWVGSHPHPLVVRTVGGPIRYKRNGAWEDGTVGWRVSLALGEEIVLFSSPHPDNLDFTDIFETSFFREDGSGQYTSSYLFKSRPVELADFKEKVQLIADSPKDAACPVDEFPEGYVAPHGASPEPNKPEPGNGTSEGG